MEYEIDRFASSPLARSFGRSIYLYLCIYLLSHPFRDPPGSLRHSSLAHRVSCSSEPNKYVKPIRPPSWWCPWPRGTPAAMREQPSLLSREKKSSESTGDRNLHAYVNTIPSGGLLLYSWPWALRSTGELLLHILICFSWWPDDLSNHA